ncbi:siphovirus Gp157 family protein [Sodalis sp. RH23]|uniref:siphovirus Gp157 family protein n=1 Tax=unclassified Sodalis (in: enterobacteria) TaxID=2636512 RepID=UPI0039B5E8E6
MLNASSGNVARTSRASGEAPLFSSPPIADKFDATYSLVRNLDGLAKNCDEEAARLSARKKSFETQAKNLKNYILNCLLAATQDSLNTTSDTFTAAKGSARVIIDNESQLPDEFVDISVITAPDKKAIKDAIDTGVIVPGAHIETSPRSLRVR